LLYLDANEDTTMAVYHIGRNGRTMLSRSATTGELARVAIRETNAEGFRRTVPDRVDWQKARRIAANVGAAREQEARVAA
jgi:hypothetical protein